MPVECIEPVRTFYLENFTASHISLVGPRFIWVTLLAVSVFDPPSTYQSEPPLTIGFYSPGREHDLYTRRVFSCSLSYPLAGLISWFSDYSVLAICKTWSCSSFPLDAANLSSCYSIDHR